MTMKVAKEWFKAHPQCVVTFHRRWDQLPPASRERLSTPRGVKIAGHSAVFDCRTAGRSEVTLRGVVGEVEAGQLRLINERGEHFVTYGPVT